jgi:hypothetical protein
MPRYRIYCLKLECMQFGEELVVTRDSGDEIYCPSCGEQCQAQLVDHPSKRKLDEDDTNGSNPQPKKNKRRRLLTLEKIKKVVPRCEYNTRLDGTTVFVDMKDGNGKTNYWDTYGARSKVSRPQTHESFDSTGLEVPSKIPMGFYAKTGTFKNVFGFNKTYRELVSKKHAKPRLSLGERRQQRKERRERNPTGHMYQASLEYRTAICKYIIGKVRAKNQQIVLNADDEYPCVLVKTPGGPTRTEIPNKGKLENNVKVWTRFVMAYFVGMANHLAWSSGIPIEIVMRSSFGHLCPTIAECIASYRINVGIVPLEYVDVLVDTIVAVHEAFETDFKQDLEKVTLDQNDPFVQLRDDYFLDKLLLKVQSNKPKVTREQLVKILKSQDPEGELKQKKWLKDKERMPQKLSDGDNLWEWLWGAGDSMGKTVLYQIVERGQASLEGIADGVTEALFANSKTSDVVSGFTGRFQVSGKKSTISFEPLPVAKIKKFSDYSNKTVPIADDAFWQMVQLIMSSLGGGSDFGTFREDRSVAELYAYLEQLNVHFIMNEAPSLLDDTQDGVGSDSEEEVELELEPKPNALPTKAKVYSKKLICATGMRAIHLAQCCAKLYAADSKLDITNVKSYAKKMYYETEEALTEVTTRIKNDIITDRKKTVEVLFFDMNHCNCAQEKYVAMDFTAFDVVVLDHTSATQPLVYHYLKQVFSIDRVKLVLLVGSGLKNEQSGGDMNTYGCIRIMTSDRRLRNYLYDELVKLESAYQHPKESHAIRKAYKEMGFVPTTLGFLQPSLSVPIFEKPQTNPTFDYGQITFEVLDVDPDGDCLFSAIAVAETFGGVTNVTTRGTRDTIVGKLKEHLDLVPGGMYLQVGLGYSVVHVTSKEEYLDKMDEDLVWGGLTEIRAYSLRTPVLVFEDPTKPHLFRNGAEVPIDWNNLPVGLIYLAFYGNHFAALVRK